MLSKTVHLAPVVEIGHRDAHVGDLIRPFRGEDEPVRLRIGQRAQQHAVDDREDGGVGADAQRQRQHRDGGEAGAARELPRPVPQVLPQGVHSILQSLA
jgi:hypothetical protein